MNAESRPAEGVKALIGLARGPRLYAGLTLLFLALTSSLAAFLLFVQDINTGLSWTLQVTGIFFFAVAMAFLFHGSKDPPTSEPLDYRVVVFGIGILGVAIFMRFYQLADLPFGTWYDEADLGLRAQQLLLDPNYRPLFLRDHALAYYFPALGALSFKLFGVGTLSIRAVSILFGLASVVVSFFLGREIYGNRFGLLLAFFFAVARWPITFDRLGMTTSTGPFFILLVLLLLFLGRRTFSTRYFAWAGLAMGIGLGFHGSLRPFLLVVLFFLAYWTADQLRSHRGDHSFRVAWRVNLAAVIVGVGLASGPLLQVAIRQPDDFWSRAREVSIFEHREEPNLVRAIGSNTVKNALMFNYQGDRNGRHNLPGEPMLDPVTGALFVLGFALALSRFRRLAEMLFVVVFLVGLTAAILTVDFEAPQAQRAVGAMAAVFFFAALAAEAYWRALERTRSPFWARPLGIALLLLAGAAIVYANYNTHFVRQASDGSVWQSHSTIETVTARKMAELGSEGMTLYISMFMKDHPVIRFLAPGQQAKVVVPPDILPLREPGDRPVAVLLDVEQAWIAREIEGFYPNARVTIASNPNGVPMQYTVVVPPEDIRQVQGLAADYWPGLKLEGAPEISRVEDGVNASWPAEAPLEQPFVAEWRGVLYAPVFGQYELLLQSPGPASLWLDGEMLIENEKAGEQRSSPTLAQGNHALRIQANGGEGLLQMSWSQPQGGEPVTIPAWALYHAPRVASQGLLGAFYEGGDWRGAPALERIDPFIDAYFHLIPLERPYSVVWTGEIEIPQDGLYSFGLELNGQAQLFIDGQLVVNASEPAEYVEGSLNLEAGRYDLSLPFIDNVSGSRLSLYWTPPGQERQIIPSEALFPGQAPE